MVVDPDRVDIVLPEDFALPPGGLNIRWPDTPLQMEARLLDYKLYAALAYCRSNGLNATVIDAPHARFGIVASGKAYLDTRQALTDLGLDEATCQRIGIRVFKCAMPWPLEAHTISRFAEGLTEILVIEEKRQVIEYQLKEELFQWLGSGKKIPRVIGKFDEKDGGEWAVPQGNWILPAHYEFSPAIVAKAIAARIAKLELPAEVRARIDARIGIIEAKERALAAPRIVAERVPYFCSGCPHNTSTKVPDGSRAIAGIGCHYMVTWMDRNTATFSQMGGEGVPWIGQAPFTSEPHVFANLGDGTYFHSGILAVRAAVAARVPITYKILFNDAVAMTGGQPIDGLLTVPQITRQLAAEGVGRIVVVSERADDYARTTRWRPACGVEPRATLRRRAARVARVCRRAGADFRSVLRDRTAPPPQARAGGRSAAARHHQRTGLRGLRRLRRGLQLPVRGARGNRVRAQAAHQPVNAATRTNPASRASARASSRWWAASRARRRATATRCRRWKRRPSPRRAMTGPTASSSRASAAPGS